MKPKIFSIYLVTLVVISLLISACNGNQLSSSTPSITSTPFLMPTATSTITSTSTPTDTPTITPTLTPVPILNTNANGLIPLTRCGVGTIHFSYAIAFSPDGNWLGVPGFGGIQIFNANNPALSPIFLGQNLQQIYFLFPQTAKFLHL